jgi:RHS repeat-associated protein
MIDTYDDNGNRLTELGTPSGADASYDAQDRLRAFTTGNGHVWQFTYADNGALQSRTDTTANAATNLTYDELGNLVYAELVNNGIRSVSMDYVVDGRGRRIGKKVYGSFTRRWIYDGQLRIIAELATNGSTTTMNRFVYGSRTNTPELMLSYSSPTAAPTVYRIFSDHLGSPRLVVNASTGAVLLEVRYNSFGYPTLVQGSSLDVIPFGFAGGLYDVHTGLVRFGARDYDPRFGRWVSKDPSLFAARGVNLYQYAMADPVNFADMTGRDVCVYSSSQGYHHQWLGFNGDSSQSYGFWPGTSPVWGPGQLRSPDWRSKETSDPGTTATCRQSSAAEDEQLKDWIKNTYPINQVDSQHYYSPGISDCRAFTGEAMRQMDAIQGYGPSLIDILSAFW